MDSRYRVAPPFSNLSNHQGGKSKQNLGLVGLVQAMLWGVSYEIHCRLGLVLIFPTTRTACSTSYHF